MRSIHGSLLLSVVLGVLVGAANAQPVISLNSSQFTAIEVGDTITVDVMLSGLAAGDMLDLLAAEVVYDDQHFGTPTVTSGGIIPDASGFTADEFTDLAGASFDSIETTTGTDVITANGAFFSFDITAIALGSGQITIDFADALGEDSLSDPIDGASTGAALNYIVLFPGDYNFDDVVDAADYTVWRDTLGQTGVALAADGDGSGTIDQGDYSVWKLNFGAAAPSALTGNQQLSSPATAIPEPSAWVIAMVGLCGAAVAVRVRG